MRDRQSKGDKVWCDTTISLIKKWAMDRGMVENTPYYGLRHPDASFSLSIRNKVEGGWSYTDNYDVVEITCSNSIRNFTKQITRDKTVIATVLEKIGAKLDECIEQKRRQDAAYESRRKREAFQKAYMDKHFPDTGKLSVYPCDGITDETIRFKIDASFLTPEQVKKVIAALA